MFFFKLLLFLFRKTVIPNNSTVEYTCSDGDFEMFNGSSASNGVKINGSKFSITCKFDTLSETFSFEGKISYLYTTHVRYLATTRIELLGVENSYRVNFFGSLNPDRP